MPASNKPIETWNDVRHSFENIIKKCTHRKMPFPSRSRRAKYAAILLHGRAHRIVDAGKFSPERLLR